MKKRGEGSKRDRLHWRVQGVRAVRRVVFWGVMELGMPKEKYVRISMKEIWRNLDGPSKNKELCSYVVSFELAERQDSMYHGLLYTSCGALSATGKCN